MKAVKLSLCERIMGNNGKAERKIGEHRNEVLEENKRKHTEDG